MKKAKKQKAVYSQSRSDLMELRRLIMETKDTKVKNLSMEICEIADRILKTWKGQAEDPSAI